MKFCIFFIVILMLAEHFPSNHAGIATKEIDKDELISEVEKLLERGQKFVDQHRYDSDEKLILLYLAEMAEIEILLSKIEMTSKQERLKSITRI
ncbi:hypothetical protein DERP_007012 [Dermatophagoides pteronyssinus]|uniref:Secreted protein n=1 Tax=Dermatophagoides pteronyssinus TaxID=6956 RepID=A0ABQ8JV01_DERPT|nr:hypothetical protein DERP_007012 [Dermatophagoides pteronyssinus]